MKKALINKACSIIQFQDRAFLSGREVVKNNVLGENDIRKVENNSAVLLAEFNLDALIRAVGRLVDVV
jgi:hypothetical protein